MTIRYLTQRQGDGWVVVRQEGRDGSWVTTGSFGIFPTLERCERFISNHQ